MPSRYFLINLYPEQGRLTMSMLQEPLTPKNKNIFALRNSHTSLTSIVV